jgi:type III secretion protein J
MKRPRNFIVSLVSFWLAACGGSVELLRDLSEPEANEVMAALMESGLNPEKLPGKDGAVTLSIDKSHFSRAIALLNSEGLPHEKHAKMGDIFRKEGMISSPLEERARYLWALSQELSATVSQIDGVVRARVHVVLPERGNGADPSLPSSAAVFIKHKPGFNYDEVIPEIKRLVSNSIPGLSQEKVTIVVVPSMSKQTQSDAAASNAVENAKLSSVSASGQSALASTQSNFKLWVACAGLLAVLCAVAFFIWDRWTRFAGTAGRSLDTAKLKKGLQGFLDPAHQEAVQGAPSQSVDSSNR